MNQVTVVDQPDYKLKISVEPLVNSTLNKIELTREYYNEGVQSNSSSFIVFFLTAAIYMKNKKNKKN